MRMRNNVTQLANTVVYGLTESLTAPSLTGSPLHPDGPIYPEDPKSP